MIRFSLHHAVTLCGCTLLAIATSSCGLWHPKPPPKAKLVLFDWHDDHGPGAISVHINLARQIATYRRGGRPIGWSFVCSGKKGHATPPGNYQISEMLDVKYSDRYGWLADAAGNVTNSDATPATPVPIGEHYSPAPMYHWMRLTHYGIGMHAGEITRPGIAASHGCIRLPRDFAPILYQVVCLGTPVVVSQEKSNIR